ncbi:MAG: GTPase HflX [Treponemataceae bacterium]
MHELVEPTKKALLVFTAKLQNDKLKILQADVAQGELKSLVESIGLEVVGEETFKIGKINPATFIGRGQLEKLATVAKSLAADVVVFNTQLNPRIQRNLENELSLCVIDREEVIIQIFADRAQTAEAKLQVELASLKYSLPRLTRKWTELSQQRGGVFRSRGAGETKLELSRRVARKRITVLNKKLKTVESVRNNQRKNRLNSELKTGSIVGYTNSGKSSLLQVLSKQKTGVKNKLFATLDSLTKKVFLPCGEFVLLTDTVGFVDNLPHDLIDAFKSTLEETKYSDFLIILCDASHPAMLECLDVTQNVLQDLNCEEKKQIIFINKTDKTHNAEAVASLKRRYPNSIVGSIKEKKGIDELLNAVQKFL